MPLLSKKRKSTEKTRVTLDLSAPFYERLEKLQSLVDANTKADLIRQALQLYEYMAQKTSLGYRFRQVNQEGKEENLIFFDLPKSDME
jgi:hypothetical protein